MMLRTVFIMLSASMSGIHAGIPTKLETSNEGSCFCPVDETGGKCDKKKYKEVPSTQGLEACREFCALEPGDCKGFAFSGDRCFLYGSVPRNVKKASRKGKNFKDFQCYALNGRDGGDYELFPPASLKEGGKCNAPINSGTTACQQNPLYTNCATTKSFFYIKGKYPHVQIPVDERLPKCKDWCTSRGTLCNGFDFDESAGKCVERRYTPTGTRGSSRQNYSDWFCHKKTCDCS